MILATIILLQGSRMMAQDVGVLTGSFESYNQYYVTDEKTASEVPDSRIGSNNYFKLDYRKDNFTFGIRFEGYFPPLLGYPQEYNNRGIVNRFASFQNELLKVTAGNFYEQFGSGLVLRAFEERLLGIDNSIDGVNVHFNPHPGITLKGVLGEQRDFFELSEGQIRGFDGEFSMKRIMGFEKNTDLLLGFSAASKFQEYTGSLEDFPEIVNAYSYRMAVQGAKANLELEYATKSSDPSTTNAFGMEDGSAALLRLGYFIPNLGANLTLRRIENFDFRSNRDAEVTRLWINYVPAETRQHGYLLSNIYPYNPQNQGEVGGQIDLTYNLKKGSGLGGKYGTNIYINFAKYNSLKLADEQEGTTDFIGIGDVEYYEDFNVEIKRKISKKFQMVYGYVSQTYNRQVVEGIPSDLIKTNIAIVEAQIKFPKRRSARIELQHLWTTQDQKDWLAYLLEYNMAPKWSLYVFDQYNYGAEEEIHYYQVGFAYIKGSTRIAGSYGRQRGGLLCVGGVCRFVPFATGWNLNMSTSF